MHIIYAGLRAERYDERRKPSFEYVNFYLTLGEMPGVKVAEYPFDTILERGRDAWNNELFELVKRESPDVLFIFMYTDEILPKTLDRIHRETETKIIGWFADDYWRFWNYSRFYAPHMDLAVTTFSNAAKWYAEAGIRNVFFSQWAANPAIFHPVPVSGQDIAVSFVGQYKPGRAKYLRALERVGVHAEAFGIGWPNGRVAQGRLPEIYCRSSINLNFDYRPSRFSPRVLGRIFFTKSRNRIVPDLHFVRNAQAWWHFAIPHIHARPFEIAACGGFVLSSRTEGLERYYEDGKEMVYFNGNEDDLAEKVRKYLALASVRERIAKAGYERTIKEHTYEKRFKDIFSMAIKNQKR